MTGPTMNGKALRYMPAETREQAMTPTVAGIDELCLLDAGEGPPELILIATGSEVSLALDAHRQLAREGIRSRVVSMPSWELLGAHPPEYRDAVLPPAVYARVSVEAVSCRSAGNVTSAAGC